MKQQGLWLLGLVIVSLCTIGLLQLRIDQVTTEDTVAIVELRPYSLASKAREARILTTTVAPVETTEAVAPETQFISFELPQQSSFKSFAYYTVLSRSSPQWRIQELAYTDENGLRKVDDAFCVALGTYYGTVLGTRYLVTLDNGSSFFIILCDVKSDRHTDETHRFTISNGCACEFYVDPDALNPIIRRSGNVSSLKEFEGEIISIQQVG